MAGGLLRCVAAALLTVTVLGGGAGAAYAHTELDNSIPAEGSTVVRPPGSVQLNFSEPIDAELASVVVRGPDGTDLAVGPPRQSGPGLMQPIAASADPGDLVVSFRVVSLDGHPVSDSFTFEVLRGDAGAAAPSGQDDSAGGAADEGGAGLPLGALVGAGLVVVLVAAGAVLARRRRETPPAGPRTTAQAP